MPLVAVVQEKTQGNPFFVRECEYYVSTVLSI